MRYDETNNLAFSIFSYLRPIYFPHKFPAQEFSLSGQHLFGWERLGWVLENCESAHSSYDYVKRGIS